MRTLPETLEALKTSYKYSLDVMNALCDLKDQAARIGELETAVAEATLAEEQQRTVAENLRASMNHLLNEKARLERDYQLQVGPLLSQIHGLQDQLRETERLSAYWQEQYRDLKEAADRLEVQSGDRQEYCVLVTYRSLERLLRISGPMTLPLPKGESSWKNGENS